MRFQQNLTVGQTDGTNARSLSSSLSLSMIHLCGLGLQRQVRCAGTTGCYTFSGGFFPN